MNHKHLQTSASSAHTKACLIGITLGLGLFSQACVTKYGYGPYRVENTDSQDVSKTPQDVLDPPALATPDPTGTPTPKQSCYDDSYFQPLGEIVNDLDVLFVTDTSGSLDAERKNIANGIGSFTQKLPPSIHYQFSVMLAHGSPSTAYSGELYGLNPTTGPFTFTTQKALYDTLTGIKIDSSSDGGELGLYSFSIGLSGQHLDRSRSRGFFRDTAALAVVFISDENDICYPGQAIDFDHLHGEPGGEIQAYQRDCTSGEITAEKIIKKVKALQGDRPFLFGAIIYTDPSKVPGSPPDENEVGLGYKDIVEKSDGVLVDILNSDYNQGLARIGEQAYKKLTLLNGFGVKGEIDLSSVQTFVDGKPVDWVYDSVLKNIRVSDPGSAGSKIELHYCSNS